MEYKKKNIIMRVFFSQQQSFILLYTLHHVNKCFKLYPIKIIKFVFEIKTILKLCVLWYMHKNMMFSV